MAVTTGDHVATVLGATQSPQFERSYRAAESAVAAACRWPDGPAPDALVEAVVLRTARYLARLDSPSGVIGVGEYGPVRVSSVDRDIEDLEAPWRQVVFS